jgi:hypothetical protein
MRSSRPEDDRQPDTPQTRIKVGPVAGYEVPDRQLPRAGEMVNYWQLNPAAPSGCDASVAIVLGAGNRPGTLDINVLLFGSVHGAANIPWAAEPRIGCWSFRD